MEGQVTVLLCVSKKGHHSVWVVMTTKNYSEQGLLARRVALMQYRPAWAGGNLASDPGWQRPSLQWGYRLVRAGGHPTSDRMTAPLTAMRVQAGSGWVTPDDTGWQRSLLQWGCRLVWADGHPTSGPRWHRPSLQWGYRLAWAGGHPISDPGWQGHLLQWGYRLVLDGGHPTSDPGWQRPSL